MANLSFDSVKGKVKAQVVSCRWCDEDNLTWVKNRNDKRYMCDISTDPRAAESGLTAVQSNIGEIYILRFSAHNCEVIAFAKELGITRTDDDGDTKLDLAEAKIQYKLTNGELDREALEEAGLVEREEEPTLLEYN